jgi:phytoene/squalene synthetase
MREGENVPVAGKPHGLIFSEETEMKDKSALLAHRITWEGSKQSYLTARLLVDRDLVNDCLRGYAYFRWADDMIDLTLNTSADRSQFILRQKMLIERLYCGERPADLCPQEQMLADLIAHDRGPDGGLRTFIDNFMKVIEFDAQRKGRLVSAQELNLYTAWLAEAVMDGIQYFIGNGHPYPRTPERTLAVTGAHLVHMLRDMPEDLPAGYVNIPAEDLREYGISPDDVESKAFRRWVQVQVEKARACFRSGRRYCDSLDVLRCKLAGAWYCARFEWYLDAIPRDGYRIRSSYPGRKGMKVWLEMAGLGLTVTLRHFVGRVRRDWPLFRTSRAIRLDTNNSAYRVE